MIIVISVHIYILGEYSVPARRTEYLEVASYACMTTLNV